MTVIVRETTSGNGQHTVVTNETLVENFAMWEEESPELGDQDFCLDLHLFNLEQVTDPLSASNTKQHIPMLFYKLLHRNGI